MSEFSQDMAAIAAVLLAATSTIKASLMCIKALKASVTINIDKNVWWRRLGFAGWYFILKVFGLGFGMLFGLYELRLLSLVKTPLTTGDAAQIVLYVFLLVLGFYPPASLEPKLLRRTPAP